MTPAKLIGLMYQYDKKDTRDEIVRQIFKAQDDYLARFGVLPTKVVVAEGCDVAPIHSIGLEVETRKWVRPYHFLVGEEIGEK